MGGDLTKQIEPEYAHDPSAGLLPQGEIDRYKYMCFLMMLYHVYV